MSAMADEYVQVPYTPFQHPQEAHEELCDLPDDTLDPLKIFSYFWDDGLLTYWSCSVCLVHLYLTCFGFYHLGRSRPTT